MFKRVLIPVTMAFLAPTAWAQETVNNEQYEHGRTTGTYTADLTNPME